MNRRPWIAGLLLSAGFLLGLAGCSGKTKTEGGSSVKNGEAGPVELKIGANLELSGKVAGWGEDSKKGMQLAVDELNADPKSGVKLSILFEDNASDAAKSKDAVKKLILQDNVNVVVGAVASNDTMAAMEVARDEHIPMVTHASTNVTITQKGGKCIFRICFHDDFQGQVMAKFAKDELKAQSAVLVVAKGNAYSEGLVKSFKEAFTAGGGKVLSEEAYQEGDTDFQTLVTKIKSADPDVVWVPGYYNEVPLIIKQARAIGFQKPFLGGDGWDDPKLYDLGGADIKDNYFCNHFSPSSTNPMVQTFVKNYGAKYNAKPGAMAALGYDAIYCIADAARRAGSSDPEKLRDAIQTLKDVKTLCGDVTMGEDREVIKPAMILKTGEKEHVFHMNFK
ncbi:MAG: ABC transporter substrate-binding protein [Planctomycetes bacterium]|nr:ABC transporter substrate-binding protein [Planctomycetota bacterium]